MPKPILKLSTRSARCNAKQYSARFFALHMAPGVCDYENPDTGERERVLVTQEAINRMNKTFEGKPLFVLHSEAPSASEGGDLSNLEHEQDGVVVKSFYNENDGQTWVEFMATTDAAQNAIKRGWRVSNSYLPIEVGEGGTWHNVPFDEEVYDGIFEHLALVPDPRYEEVMVLTPDEFREYNERKRHELRSLQNSKGKGKKLMPFGKGFKLFQRTPVKDSRRLRNSVVEIDGEQVRFQDIVADVSDELENRRRRNHKNTRRSRINAEGSTAVLDQEVEVGGKSMTVRDLIALYMEMQGHGSMENARDDDDDDEDENKKKKNSRGRSIRRDARDDDDGMVITVRSSRRNENDQGQDDEDELVEDDELDGEDYSGRRNSRAFDGGAGGADDPRQGGEGDEDEEEGNDSQSRSARRNTRSRRDHAGPDDDGNRDQGGEDDDEDDELDTFSRANRGARSNASVGNRPGKNSRGGKNGKRTGGARGNARDGRDGWVQLSRHEQEMLREHRRTNSEGLRHARESFEDNMQDTAVDTSMDQLARGFARYGGSTAEVTGGGAKQH